MRIRDTNKKNGALEFVIQQQAMTGLQPLTVAWLLQLFLSNHPVKYARHAQGMPLQVWKQTASDKDKSAVAGEIAIITIIGLTPETNEKTRYVRSWC